MLATGMSLISWTHTELSAGISSPRYPTLFLQFLTTGCAGMAGYLAGLDGGAGELCHHLAQGGAAVVQGGGGAL